MTDPTRRPQPPEPPHDPYGPARLPPPWYELTPDPATAPPGGPAEPPPKQEKGLFGSLFDTGFDDLVTTRLLRMLYTLAILCVTGFNLILFMFGWSLAAGSFWPFLGWTLVVGVPVLWLAELIMVRVVVEYLLVQHKIATDLTVVREVVKDIRAGRS
jgi:Domain of unknown function (DUF4282)